MVLLVTAGSSYDTGRARTLHCCPDLTPQEMALGGCQEHCQQEMGCRRTRATHTNLASPLHPPWLWWSLA